jgi:hypothetical protein
MIEIYGGIYIGSEDDLPAVPHGWSIIHAAKHPYFVDLAAPPGVLWVQDGKVLTLNIVDSDDPFYFRKDVIIEAIKFIAARRPVFIHCNEGKSRAPSIGMAYVGRLYGWTFEESEKWIKSVYPPYFPNRGIRGFLKKTWGQL